MVLIAFFGIFVALIWIGVTGQVSLGGFAVGYAIGVATLTLLRKLGVTFHYSLRPDQPFVFLVYMAVIFWNGLISSLQVVKLVLSPKIELRTGIVALPTGDDSDDQELAALSAHGINMSPGQLVIDFDDRGTLYIHCLDLEASLPTLEIEQRRRLLLLQRILGRK
jgi:multicomponent Na+:H+ antiporter subunit E